MTTHLFITTRKSNCKIFLLNVFFILIFFVLVQTFFTSAESVAEFPDFNTLLLQCFFHMVKRSVVGLKFKFVHIPLLNTSLFVQPLQDKIQPPQMVCKDHHYLFLQFSSVAQSCLTLCNPMSCSMLGLPVQHELREPTQTYVHLISDAIKPSHPLSSPAPPALNCSHHQGLFK